MHVLERVLLQGLHSCDIATKTLRSWQVCFGSSLCCCSTEVVYV